MKIIIVLLLLLLFVIPVDLQARQKSGGRFSLFHPVPDSLLREMDTDRPGTTESPHTTDAGHLQYETGLLEFEKQTTDGKKEETLLLNHANLKIGITNSTEVQVRFQTFGKNDETDLETGVRQSSSGFGDITLGVKQSLAGNDDGNFALAVLPYIKFPTAAFIDDNLHEGGVILPMQVQLKGEWKLGMQVKGERLKDDDGKHLHTELGQSLNLSHSLFGNLDAFAETSNSYNVKEHHWVNHLNAALQVSVSHNLKLDAGLSYGLQSEAEKNYFAGASFRF